jgi:nitrite reductase/ring-hydroxylating ferredoxin subunit
MSDTANPRWREDFPIRWDDDHYVTRRELAKFLTLGSGLLAGANVLIAVIGQTGRAPEPPERRIAAVESIAPGTSLVFHYPTGEDPCILVRDADGAFRAYSQVCTHLSCAVVYRPADRVLHCPCHQGVFAVGDGRPIAGPPVRPLPRIRIEQRGGDLFATGVEL